MFKFVPEIFQGTNKSHKKNDDNVPESGGLKCSSLLLQTQEFLVS
jgi:hypothetical protein